MAVEGAELSHLRFITSSSALKEARMSFSTWLGCAVRVTARRTEWGDVTRLLGGSFPS